MVCRIGILYLVMIIDLGRTRPNKT